MMIAAIHGDDALDRDQRDQHAGDEQLVRRRVEERAERRRDVPAAREVAVDSSRSPRRTRTGRGDAGTCRRRRQRATSAMTTGRQDDPQDVPAARKRAADRARAVARRARAHEARAIASALPRPREVRGERRDRLRVVGVERLGARSRGASRASIARSASLTSGIRRRGHAQLAHAEAGEQHARRAGRRPARRTRRPSGRAPARLGRRASIERAARAGRGPVEQRRRARSLPRSAAIVYWARSFVPIEKKSTSRREALGGERDGRAPRP